MSTTKVWFFMVLFLLLFGVGAGFLNDNQPYLHASRQALETARIQLGKVTPDKGGHRSKALAHINAAIQEVKIAEVEHRNISETASQR